MRAWSKCVLWCAALLSPLQTLQGTPVLHAFAGIGHGTLISARNDTSDGNAACPCCPEVVDLETTSEGASRRDTDLPADGWRVNVPRTCPPDCFCQRPAEPQSEPTSQVRWSVVESPAELAVDQTHAKCIAALDAYTELPSEVSSPATARQVCAFLCRFTT